LLELILKRRKLMLMPLIVGVIFIGVVIAFSANYGTKIFPKDTSDDATLQVAVIILFVLLPLVGFFLSR